MIRIQTVTIAQDASASSALKLGGLSTPIAILMPAAWTAAGLSAEISVDGVTYYPVYITAGTLVTITTAASQAVRLSPLDYSGLMYLRFRSVNTGTGAAVTQAAARTLTIICQG